MAGTRPTQLNKVHANTNNMMDGPQYWNRVGVWLKSCHIVELKQLISNVNKNLCGISLYWLRNNV